MKAIYVLDWLINKPIKLNIDKYKHKILEISNGTKVLYKTPDMNQQLVGINLGHECETIKEGNFIKVLDKPQIEQFDYNQKTAGDLFKIFKKSFKSNFPESIPVSAKMDLSGKIIYFYFYAEVRFQFQNFIKDFRKLINMNFFLFQIGARDRIRYSQGSNFMYGTCGHILCCKTGKCPLDSVDSENIALQNLENRGIEKVKGRCGKLKCCLNYEKQIYKEESNNFPNKGYYIKYNNAKQKILNYNIMNGEMLIKNESNDDISKIKLSDLPKGRKKDLIKPDSEEKHQFNPEIDGEEQDLKNLE